MIERAGQALGSLRFLAALKGRDAAHELRALRLRRMEAMRPTLLCHHRGRLKKVSDEVDFLQKVGDVRRVAPAPQDCQARGGGGDLS